MKNVVLAGSLAVLLAFAGSGRAADTHEALIKESLKVMNGLADILEKITDKETAQKNKKDLETQVDKMKGLKKKADKLGKPEKEEKDRLEKIYKEDMTKATKRLIGAFGKVSTNKEVLDELKDIFKKVQN